MKEEFVGDNSTQNELEAMINHDLSDSRVPLRTSQLYEPALLIYL